MVSPRRSSPDPPAPAPAATPAPAPSLPQQLLLPMAPRRPGSAAAAAPGRRRPPFLALVLAVTLGLLVVPAARRLQNAVEGVYVTRLRSSGAPLVMLRFPVVRCVMMTRSLTHCFLRP